MPYDRSDLPDGYAHAYTTRALRMDAGEDGQYIRQFQPHILPDVPMEIFLAFIAPGYTGSDTTEGTSSASQSVAFREVGKWQTPAGARGGPSPAPGSAYYTLASDPAVVAALGRRANTAEQAWRTAVADQTAIGLADLRNNYNATVARMDPSIRPSSPATPWGTWMFMTGFSAGPAGAADLANHYKTQLAAVDESCRPGLLTNLMALDIQNRVPLAGSPDRHSTLAHRVLRSNQKFRLAQSIARAKGDADAVAYFDLWLGDKTAAHDDLILRGNWHMDPGTSRVEPIECHAPAFSAPGSVAPKVIGAGLLLLAFAAAWKAAS